jgi:hypothetical protein
MFFRLFIDEVGNGDLKGAATDPNIRFLSLTGVLTRVDLHDKIIQPQIDGLKKRLFEHTPATPVILHRRELVRKDRQFWPYPLVFRNLNDHHQASEEKTL